MSDTITTNLYRRSDGNALSGSSCFRSPQVVTPLLARIWAIQSCMNSPLKRPSWKINPKPSPTCLKCLKIRDSSSNCEKSSSIMIFVISSMPNPAASIEATIAPADVPATRRKLYGSGWFANTLMAPTRPAPFTPPPSRTRSAFVIVVSNL